MNRRSFLGLGAAVAAVTAAPVLALAPKPSVVSGFAPFAKHRGEPLVGAVSVYESDFGMREDLTRAIYDLPTPERGDIWLRY